MLCHLKGAPRSFNGQSSAPSEPDPIAPCSGTSFSHCGARQQGPILFYSREVHTYFSHAVDGRRNMLYGWRNMLPSADDSALSCWEEKCAIGFQIVQGRSLTSRLDWQIMEEEEAQPPTFCLIGEWLGNLLRKWQIRILGISKPEWLWTREASQSARCGLSCTGVPSISVEAGPRVNQECKSLGREGPQAKGSLTMGQCPRTEQTFGFGPCFQWSQSIFLVILMQNV